MSDKIKTAERSEKQSETLSFRRKALMNGGVISHGNSEMLNFPQTAGNLAIQRLMLSNTIQSKLTIGQPNDPYEREADRVADQIMQMPEQNIQRKPT